MMDLRRYLDRIQISGVEAPRLSHLAALQENHLRTVPFENLDIVLGREIVLDPERQFEKVVHQRRGGFCYELNGLFHWLLVELGFDVTMVSGRVFNPKKKRFGPDFDHMALLVRLDRTYLVDVGFGDTFRAPLSLEAGEVEDHGHYYRVVPVDDGRDEYALECSRDQEWQCQYRFSMTPRRLSDFEDMCRYQQTSPASIFTRGPLVYLVTAEGRRSLFNRRLTQEHKGRVDRTPAPPLSHLGPVLSRWFNLDPGVLENHPVA